MATSFLVLWSQDRLARLKKAGELGKPLYVLYGSPHISAPSLARYGVTTGDSVYIVGMKLGALLLVARVKLGSLMAVGEFFRDHLGVSHADAALHIWDLEKKLARERPELGHALPFGCVNEAALVADSTPTRLDLEVPLDVAERISFRTQKGAVRALSLQAGKVRAITIQGHYLRLVPDAAAALDRLLANACH